MIPTSWFATWYATMRSRQRAARALLESLTVERPGFVCREVIVELVWVLERSYKQSRDRIATVLEQLAATDSLVVEADADVIRAASRYRSEVSGFADLMILAATERSEAHPLYTFDQKAARVEGVELLKEKWES